MTADDELLAVFKAEVAEEIERLTQHLQLPPGEWDVQTLFRLAHNVKGAARMVDAMAVRDASHELESLFSKMRDGLPYSAELGVHIREGAKLLAESFHQIDPATPEAEEKNTTTLRIAIDRLDRMNELASELTATHYRMDERWRQATVLQSTLSDLLRKNPALHALPELKSLRRSMFELRQDLGRDRSHFGQLSGQFKDALRVVRMTPIGSLQTLLTKVLRDACEATGKQAVLRIDGADTEIDRALLDTLRDPLLHLIRNAVAHGIEDPADRVLAGKPPGATVVFRAQVEGARVDVSIADDGRGIDWERVRAKAVSKGISAPAQADLVECLFSAGFSTAEALTELSGRGVGLDVVRQNIEVAGGEIEVENLHPGARFRMRIPLTRLTTRGILVRVGRHLCSFPVVHVERTLFADERDTGAVAGQATIAVGTAVVPLSALEDKLSVRGDGNHKRPIVILAHANRRQAFRVDEVLGERELAVQRLPWNMRHVPHVSGAAVIDGARMCLVINATELLNATSRGTSQPAGGTPEATRTRRILVADDSVTSRTLEKNILTQAGYDVTLATDGEEAWGMLRTHAFDLLVSDVEMPRLDGVSLTRRIRNDEQLGRLPVILVTSLGNEQHRREGAEAGANAYIVKGAFDQDLLLKSVARLV